MRKPGEEEKECHLSIPSNKTHIRTVYVNKSLKRYYKGHIQKSIETEEEGINRSCPPSLMDNTGKNGVMNRYVFHMYVPPNILTTRELSMIM